MIKGNLRLSYGPAEDSVLTVLIQSAWEDITAEENIGNRYTRYFLHHFV